MITKKKSGSYSKQLMFLLRFRTFIALIAIFIFFSFTAPNFLHPNTLILIARHVVLYGVLAIGMTLVIITGGIDLSVGSVVGLSAMIAGGLIRNGLTLTILGFTVYFSVPVIILITLAVGLAVGFVNGIVITKFKVAPFIATLGALYVCRGMAMLHSNGATYPNLVGEPALGNTGFDFLGRGVLLAIPVSIWIFAIFAVVAFFILKKTPLGWHIFAVGGNEKSARLSGIKSDKVKIMVYMFSGLCAAMVGLITASELMASHPAMGESWELNAIAAAVLGGTSMSGGIGGIGGTIIGAFVIGVLNDGMIMSGVSSFWQMVIKGLVIVVAVMIDQFQQKLQTKLALESR
jgi:erythritol transport system permease protein